MIHIIDHEKHEEHVIMGRHRHIWRMFSRLNTQKGTRNHEGTKWTEPSKTHRQLLVEHKRVTLQNHKDFFPLALKVHFENTLTSSSSVSSDISFKYSISICQSECSQTSEQDSLPAQHPIIAVQVLIRQCDAVRETVKQPADRFIITLS